MKRTDTEILRDIRRVECGLSPENLHCDGEISRSAANAKRIRLEKELKDLMKELGRTPEYHEIWGVV